MSDLKKVIDQFFLALLDAGQALSMYGEHDPGCAYNEFKEGTVIRKECTCGLAIALLKLEEEIKVLEEVRK